MIKRYEQDDMSAIWSELAKFGYFLRVEKELAAVLGEEGFVSPELSQELSSVNIRVDRIAEIEGVTGHDVIAFSQSIEEQLPEKLHSDFHFGVTSSDIIDTSLMLQLRSSNELILNEMQLLLKDISKEVIKTSDLLCVGRTHGIYAEPMIFAQKWMSFKAELGRRYDELLIFSFTGQISGAIGTYSILSPGIEKKVLDRLGLKTEEVSTQVIPRDRILSYVQIISNLAIALERMAIEFRHLQHSDIAEVFEGFEPGQKGSSIMPHKKNPIGFENITGLSRLIQSYRKVAESNCILWHERDLSHSSNERVYLPDMLGLMLYALRRTRKVIGTLHYDRKNMEEKVFSHPEILSSQLLHRELLETKRPRAEIYREIQGMFHQSNQKIKPVFLNREEQKSFYQNKFQEFLRREV